MPTPPLIRPSTLENHNDNNTMNETDNTNENQNTFLTNLSEHVTIMVSAALKAEGKKIIYSILNPDTNDDVDQSIDSQNVNSAEADKVPDLVKSLKEFSGQPEEFNSWKKSVERILHVYGHTRGTPRYYAILSVIRNKIVGHADIALESYNTPLNWDSILKCLNMHYADKRDLGTLEYQLTTLIQGHNTIPDFYQMVYQHLSLILNKLSSSEMGQESLRNMTKAYREKALDTFVRGLKGDLPRLLSIREPVDLPQALHLCLKLENVDYRQRHALNHGSSRNNTPPIPARRTNYSYLQPAPIPTPRKHFYPELIPNPQYQKEWYPKPIISTNQYGNNQSRQQHNLFRSPQYNIPYRQNHNNNLYSLPPKPLPKPEPMDIDSSTRTKAVNYMNRPQAGQSTPKRPYSNQVHQPNKTQRIFHTEQQDNNDNITEQQHHDETEDNKDLDQNLSEYIDLYDDPQYDQPEQIDDIYFLG